MGKHDDTASIRHPVEPVLEPEDQTILVELGVDARATISSDGVLPIVRGMEIGRYIVLGTIGEGGMGAVFGAYDPQLNRRIAIKIMKVHSVDERVRRTVRERLLREARALAALSHPNVVTIYDVGTYGSDIYLALEYVKGENLRQWLKHGRSRSEILTAFGSAARGLAAAHDAGLVHRDFKPSNVVIGEDGRVRVLDFGLATLASGRPATDSDSVASTEPVSGDELESKVDEFESPLTEAGRAMGTPVYMSPEQHLGEPIDAKSDQFSFCVSLYEALYGRRPFNGKPYDRFRRRVLAGQVDAAPEGSDVPRWLRAVLLRGLSPAKDDRFPSMLALLAALNDDPAIRRRRIAMAAGGGMAILGTAGLGVWLGGGTTTNRCEPDPVELAAIAGPEVEAALVESFLRTEAFGAGDTASRVSEALRSYVDGWTTEYREACQATHVRGEQSDELLDRRMRCMLRNRDQVASLVRLFREDPDGAAVRDAVRAVSDIADLRPCEPERLAEGHTVQRSPEVQARVDEIEREIDLAEVYESAGRYADGLAAAAVAVSAAEALGDPAAITDARLRQGSLRERSGAWIEAEGDYRAALAAAGRARDPSRVARGGTALMFLLGYRQAKFEQAIELATMVQAIESLGGDANESRSDTWRALGAIHITRGNLAEALGLFEQHLEHVRRTLGERHLMTAGALNNVGTTLVQLGRLDEACPTLEEALSITADALGREHVSLAPMLKNLAMCQEERGQLVEAERNARVALELEQRSGQAPSPDIAGSHYLLATVMMRQQRVDAALEEFELTKRMQEELLGPDHPLLVGTLDGLGRALLLADRVEDAEVIMRRSVELAHRVLGPDHVNTGFVTAGLATVVARLGRKAEARSLYDAARVILSDKLGPAHPKTLGYRADAAALLDDDQKAIAELDSIVAEAELGSDRAIQAQLQFNLGRRLWTSGERARSARLIRLAREYAAAHSETTVGWSEELDAFVEQQRVPLDESAPR